MQTYCLLDISFVDVPGRCPMQSGRGGLSGSGGQLLGGLADRLPGGRSPSSMRGRRLRCGHSSGAGSWRRAGRRRSGGAAETYCGAASAMQQLMQVTVVSGGILLITTGSTDRIVRLKTELRAGWTALELV